MTVTMTHYEMFCDTAYFDMWCVRLLGEKRFGYGRHFIQKGSAEKAMKQLEANWGTRLQDETETEADA